MQQQCYTAKCALDVKKSVINAEITMVFPFLYISGAQPSNNYYRMLGIGITHVLNLCGDLIGNTSFDEQFKYLVFNMLDSPNESLEDVFPACFRFIDEAREQGGKVLVHCHQGVSRSPSVVIAYLMHCNNISFENAFAHVRRTRKVTSPNLGFIY